MISVPIINWQPIATMPADRKDGRQILLWSGSEVVVVRWSEAAWRGAGFWDTGFASEVDGDAIEAHGAFWADINPPK